MADTMAIFLVILGLLLALPATWLLSVGLWPRLVFDATRRCGSGLIRPFLVGFPLAAVLTVTVILLKQIPGAPGTMLSIGSACLFIFLSQIGVAGLATCIGERLPQGYGGKTWRDTLRGGIVLELPFLLPVLGWFILLPTAMIIGLGATAISLLARMFKPSVSEARIMMSRETIQTGTLGASQ
jgi:hypothetical protein